MTEKNRYVCIHAHFYQPPRENPWLEEVELQDSAYPYHDWNERITAECYAPNAASRTLDGEGRILDITNNYERISFNFGPTLLLWMERHRPAVLEGLVAADRAARERFSGHGSAIAQVYNHMIMPLARERDRYTQAIWGIRDFEKRFGREPEGMWLPETAADVGSLEVLADLGIRFTILAPRQARRFRPLAITGTRRDSEAAGEWTDANGGIDPKIPYRCQLPSGRSIVLFFYDGPISQALAFERLLNDGEAFAQRLLGAFTDDDGPQLVHIATDGETYGHHHRHGDMALAWCLNRVEAREDVELTVYGEFLDRCPPQHDVEIWENSSWSCVHGVERWRSDCGCNTGRPDWQQPWRGPLREGIDAVNGALAPFYEEQAEGLLRDAWAARDAYVSCVLDRSDGNVARFLEEHATRPLTQRNRVKILKLLELQRHVMLMSTSCAWFFDEISGMETTQVMGYVLRAMQLARELGGPDLEPLFLEHLGRAPSNLPQFAEGAQVFAAFVRPTRLDLPRVAAHFAIGSVFRRSLDEVHIYCHHADTRNFEITQAGALSLALGVVEMDSLITGESQEFRFAVLHWGDHNVVCGVEEDGQQTERDATQRREMKSALSVGNIPAVVRGIEDGYRHGPFTVQHLFRDEQQAVMSEVLRTARQEIEASYRGIVERHWPLLNFLAALGRRLPREFATAAEFVVNRDLRDILEDEEFTPERLRRRIDDLERWKVALDREGLAFAASKRITQLMNEAAATPRDGSRLERVREKLLEVRRLDLDLDLWEAQNVYFRLGQTERPEMEQRAARGERDARSWLEAFARLAEPLALKLA
jgi:alpha-amylase/alpha-mannosidase (GH57 family)